MSNTKTKYVAGFLFDKSMRIVYLIKKNRPAWQAGKFNGIGGHVEAGEDFPEAMRRECREEAGVDIAEWIPVATVENPDVEVVIFYAKLPSGVKPRTMTDEEIVSMHVSDIYPFHPWMLPNLPMEIGICAAKEQCANLDAKIFYEPLQKND